MSINGIKERERENVAITHHVVGENNRETDEKELAEEKPLSTLS